MIAMIPALGASLLGCLLMRSPWQVELAPGPPPEALSGAGKRGVSFHTTYQGLVAAASYRMRGKEVEITWFREFGGESPARALQVEPLSFWPTEVCAFGPNRICVSGKTVAGKTRIELWEFSASEVFDDAQRDARTGNGSYPKTHVPVATRRELYEASAPGRMLVRSMFRNHGRPEALLVQFDDSKDLCALDITTGAVTTVLSSLDEPRLSADYRDRWSFDHLDRGYLYLLCTNHNANGVPEALILVDANRDGVLEPSATQLLAGSELQTVFGNPERIVERF